MLILGFAGAAFVMLILVGRQWNDLNSKDMGTMSRQWLVENQGQHP
jgi:hypothetical protein